MRILYFPSPGLKGNFPKKGYTLMLTIICLVEHGTKHKVFENSKVKLSSNRQQSQSLFPFKNLENIINIISKSFTYLFSFFSIQYPKYKQSFSRSKFWRFDFHWKSILELYMIRLILLYFCKGKKQWVINNFRSFTDFHPITGCLTSMFQKLNFIIWQTSITFWPYQLIFWPAYLGFES